LKIRIDTPNFLAPTVSAEDAAGGDVEQQARRSGQAGDLNGAVRVLLFAEADGNFIEDCDI
jgi:hypothetical protein